MKNKISTTIIAGGKGSRFGRPKYNVVFKGKKLIDAAIALAAEFSDSIFVSCGTLNCDLPDHVTALKDIIPDCGPLGGIYSALHYSNARWNIIMPVDMPYLSAQIYNTLLTYIETTDAPIVAVSQNGLEPLVSIWPKSAEKIVEKFVLEGNYSIRGCLKALNFRSVTITEQLNEAGEDCFYNINTRQDLMRSKD